MKLVQMRFINGLEQYIKVLYSINASSDI